MGVQYRCIVIGGGPAGVFAAITSAALLPPHSVLLIEKSSQLLSKVLISGGGRCNVTHACFSPRDLVAFYPRGGKVLLGPFSRFQPRDTFAWFEKRGVSLKQEDDGRIFPVTNSAKTIVSCLVGELQKQHVDVALSEDVEDIERQAHSFSVTTKNSTFSADRLVIATGSSLFGYALAEKFGHSIIQPVPSLFTFQVPGSDLLDLSGVSAENVTLSLSLGGYTQTGPMLLTHWGFSGPAVLKLSAWAARDLYDNSYRATLYINWVGERNFANVQETLLQQKHKNPFRKIEGDSLFNLPKSLWGRLLSLTGVKEGQNWESLSRKTIALFSQKLIRDPYEIQGKGAYKQEFVTAGGVCLNEIDWKTMESKIVPALHFVGEIVDIDGLTGGFNFQNAWTTGYVCGSAFQPNPSHGCFPLLNKEK
jgi:predicted Rossmann fold flavoprotein